MNNIEKLKEIFKEKGFKSIDNFIEYKNTKSKVKFICDKGHEHETLARYILYGNTGCKTCQYEKVQTLLKTNVSLLFTKVCNTCQEEKGKSSFGKLQSSYDGLRSTCKLCRRKQHELTKESSFKKRKNSSYSYCLRHPFKCLLNRCKTNHKKKAFLDDFNITAEFLEELFDKQNGKCFWSGIKMDKLTVTLNKLDTISVDRLDCNLGYLKGNVVLCCKFINLGRGNQDFSYFKEFLSSNFRINDNLLK